MTADERLVIFASSLGTVFEWYDFYIYGTLGVFLAKYFFSNVPANVGFIFALLTFAAGFAVRPFGALIFGHFGDLIGRKYTFLVTMTLMGIGTFFIGVLPGFATWGIMAPVVLIALRLIQGLALGGEYGGAAIYVAEHAPANKRGYYTSWIQTTATLGLFPKLERLRHPTRLRQGGSPLQGSQSPAPEALCQQSPPVYRSYVGYTTQIL